MKYDTYDLPYEKSIITDSTNPRSGVYVRCYDDGTCFVGITKDLEKTHKWLRADPDVMYTPEPTVIEYPIDDMDEAARMEPHVYDYFNSHGLTPRNEHRPTGTLQQPFEWWDIEAVM